MDRHPERRCEGRFRGRRPGRSRPPIPHDFIDLRVGASLANPSALSASTSVGATASIPAPEPSVMTPVKIVTVEEGIHEIRRADLDAIGASVTGIDPGSFVLTHRGQEVGIEVVDGGDGSLDAPDDFLRFYALVVGGEETRAWPGLQTRRGRPA